MNQLQLWDPGRIKQYECSECRGIGKVELKIKNGFTEIPCGKCGETGLDLRTLKEALDKIEQMEPEE